MIESRTIKIQDFWLTGWKSLGKYIDFSIKSCKRMVKDGLPKHTSPSGRPMFKASEIDSWLKKNKRD